MSDWQNEKLAKRDYLTIRLMAEEGVSMFTAIEAVASTELSHPDEDWGIPERTFAEWLEWSNGPEAEGW